MMKDNFVKNAVSLDVQICITVLIVKSVAKDMIIIVGLLEYVYVIPILSISFNSYFMVDSNFLYSQQLLLRLTMQKRKINQQDSSQTDI